MVSGCRERQPDAPGKELLPPRDPLGSWVSVVLAVDSALSLELPFLGDFEASITHVRSLPSRDSLTETLRT